MNSAVVEVAQEIGDKHGLSLRDVVGRLRRAGIEFRSETNFNYEGSGKTEQNVILGFSHESLYYPFTVENRQVLEELVLKAPHAKIRKVEEASILVPPPAPQDDGSPPPPSPPSSAPPTEETREPVKSGA